MSSEEETVSSIQERISSSEEEYLQLRNPKHPARREKNCLNTKVLSREKEMGSTEKHEVSRLGHEKKILSSKSIPTLLSKEKDTEDIHEVTCLVEEKIGQFSKHIPTTLSKEKDAEDICKVPCLVEEKISQNSKSTPNYFSKGKDAKGMSSFVEEKVRQPSISVSLSREKDAEVISKVPSFSVEKVHQPCKSIPLSLPKERYAKEIPTVVEEKMFSLREEKRGFTDQEIQSSCAIAFPSTGKQNNRHCQELPSLGEKTMCPGLSYEVDRSSTGISLPITLKKSTSVQHRLKQAQRNVTVTDTGNCLRTPVEVLSAESPSCIYVRLLSQKDKIDK